MKKIYLVTALACCALQPTLAQKQEECKPVNLHCDHLINPLGIDNANPRLSWMLDDARQGARQTAYQIIVSTDSLKANNENGEIWNSGKKESDQILVTYPEKNLQPFTKYYWKVNVWDKDGKKATSDINSFETGMMGMENWQGAWIGDNRDINYKPAPISEKHSTLKRKSNPPERTSPSPVYTNYTSTERKLETIG